MDLNPFVDALRSHALASGYFERVNGHEPKAAPGNGITGAVWLDYIGPGPGSGLAATTVLLVLNIRVMTSMLAEPQDAIDPNVLAATSALMEAYSGDFTLGGLCREVDLLGVSGRRLAAQAGYLQQDNKVFRVMTITLPVIVNDVWSQAE